MMNIASRTIGAVVVTAVFMAAGQGFGQDWPQWRGANRDGKATGFKAPATWPKEMTQKWKVSVGAGDSSPVLVGDKVFVFARQGGDEVTMCLAAADGKEVWRDKNPVAAISGPDSKVHGGPRSTPAVADGKIVTLGLTGVLSCLDAATGKPIWRKDDIKGTPRFHIASSPLIADGMVIAQLGSEDAGAIVAYDLADGKEKWKLADQGPGYASPVLMTAEGIKQIVTLTSKAVVGVGLADGKLLWQIPFPAEGRAYNAATAIVDGATVIYAGQGRGHKAVTIEKTDAGFKPKELWANAEVGVQFCSPVLSGGCLYGITDKGDLYCLDAKDGKTVWTAPEKLGGYGAMIDAGTAVLALTSKSQLIVIKPGEKQYAAQATLKAGETATYAYPALAGGTILVKDQDSLILYAME
jgi:outer membrane protein assembly factor BamB